MLGHTGAISEVDIIGVLHQSSYVPSFAQFCFPAELTVQRKDGMKKHKDGRPEAWRQGASEKREIQTYSFVHKNDILEGTYLHLVTNVISLWLFKDHIVYVNGPGFITA